MLRKDQPSSEIKVVAELDNLAIFSQAQEVIDSLEQLGQLKLNKDETEQRFTKLKQIFGIGNPGLLLFLTMVDKKPDSFFPFLETFFDLKQIGQMSEKLFFLLVINCKEAKEEITTQSLHEFLTKCYGYDPFMEKSKSSNKIEQNHEKKISKQESTQPVNKNKVLVAPHAIQFKPKPESKTKDPDAKQSLFHGFSCRIV